jgi:spermidine synthase
VDHLGLFLFHSTFGYAYAAMLTQMQMSLARWLHGLLLLAVVVIMGKRFMTDVHPIMTGAVDASAPALSVFLTLLFAVGLPVLLLASTSVLTQTLYARVSDKNPYVLYALSNIGSLSALLLYPFFIEPFIPLSIQSSVWITGFIIFIVVMMAGWFVAGKDWHSVSKKETIDTRPATFSYIAVLLFAAVPTFFLAAATEQISRGIASFPLLWIVPLVLYLLSFVVAFRDSKVTVPAPLMLVCSALALLVVPYFTKDSFHYWFGVVILSSAFFIIVTYLHSRLYEHRPAVRSLGTFYVVMTAGGAIGSGIVGLVLPQIFNDYYELPALLVGLVLYGMYVSVKTYVPNLLPWYQYIAFVIIGMAVLVVVSFGMLAASRQLATDRSFYGTLKVIESQTSLKDEQVPIRYISNGATNHGQQVMDERYSAISGSYYGENSGIDYAIKSSLESGIKPRVAVVGLGAGMMNIYCADAVVIDYVEINPTVETFARTYFTYLEQCPEKTSVTIADGRLHLEELAAKGVKYDVIMIDAFTDDTIPMHLLTREAFLNAYIPLLSEKGIIAIHTTNRYINLVPTIAAVAESVGYVAVAHTNVPAKNALSHTTMWALVMKPDYAGQFDGRTPMTEIYTAEDGAYMWTDDKSSILPALSLIGSNKLKE